MKGLTRDRRKLLNRNPLVCKKCGVSGGTLVKDGDLYVCKDTDTCALLRLRRKRWMRKQRRR